MGIVMGVCYRERAARYYSVKNLNIHIMLITTDMTTPSAKTLESRNDGAYLQA